VLNVTLQELSFRTIRSDRVTIRLGAPKPRIMLVYHSKRAFSGEAFEYRLRSGSFPCVKMVQSADFGNFHHAADPRSLDRSAGREL
jgi:hypothetical protein